MPMNRGCIAHPWILKLVENYGQSEGTPVVVAAKVVKFVKMAQNQFDKLSGPAAVVHISDRESYIQAVITNDAKRKMEVEEERFSFEDIHNKIIILKEYEIVFRQEEDLIDCGFYIRIKYFSILPMEPDREDGGINCNEVPLVKWKIKEHWHKYREETEMQDTQGDCLTQLLNVANEEKLNDLKNTAYSCLNLRGSSPSVHRNTTAWQDGKSCKTGKSVFSVPINWLIISPEEEEILNNLDEWSDGYSVVDDSDEREFCQGDAIAGTHSSTPETPSSSHTSQESCVVLSIKDDGITLPDSSTPDLLEHMEETFMNKMDSSPPLLFSDTSTQSQETCAETGSAMCETVINVDNTRCTDSGVDCRHSFSCKDPNSIHQCPVRDSPPSQISNCLDINYVNKESEDKVLVNEEDNKDETGVSATLGSDIVLFPLEGDDIRHKDKERPSEKSPRQYLKQHAAKRAHPLELISSEKQLPVDVHSCSGKTPKKKVSPLSDQKIKKDGPVPYKPKLQFLNDQQNSAAQEANATSKSDLIKGVPSKASENSQENQNSILNEKGQFDDTYIPTLQPASSMRHFDGSSLQYKYNAAGTDLCTRVRSTRLPGELLDWAFKISCNSKEREGL
ncbi:adrenocortical dysplasia protein homolog isoform X2 [Lissotriton helveticus]